MGTKWIGRIYISNKHPKVGQLLRKKDILVEFSWLDIKPDTDVWDSIRKKYLTDKDIAGVLGYIPFTRKIKPEEGLQILRLVKAEKARININRVGQIITWKLL